MASANRWSIRKMKLEDLHVADYNPRIISNRNYQGLSKSIKRFGQVEPIVWNETTGNIVGGHQRFRVLVDSGVKEALVLVVNLTPEEESAANLTLNNPTIEGEFDDPIIELLNHIKDEDDSLFRDLNFDSLQKDLEKELNQKLMNAVEEEKDEPGGYVTKCPCCKHEWEVKVTDVAIEKTE